MKRRMLSLAMCLLMVVSAMVMSACGGDDASLYDYSSIFNETTSSNDDKSLTSVKESSSVRTS